MCFFFFPQKKALLVESKTLNPGSWPLDSILASSPLQLLMLVFFLYIYKVLAGYLEVIAFVEFSGLCFLLFVLNLNSFGQMFKITLNKARTMVATNVKVTL